MLRTRSLPNERYFGFSGFFLAGDEFRIISLECLTVLTYAFLQAYRYSLSGLFTYSLAYTHVTPPASSGPRRLTTRSYCAAM